MLPHIRRRTTAQKKEDGQVLLVTVLLILVIGYKSYLVLSGSQPGEKVYTYHITTGNRTDSLVHAQFFIRPVR